MGVEPTRRMVRHNGFEDREGHRAPFTSMMISLPDTIN